MPIGAGSRRDRLFVFYTPGLDLRRVDEVRTPYVSALLDEHGSVRLRGLPDTELVPTLLTGAWPHEHGMWQLRLRPDELEPSLWSRFWMGLPDGITTTVQGFTHLLTGGQDLAAIPPRRRRSFELHRFKYERRVGAWKEPSSPYRSLFALLGAEACRYRLVSRFDEVDRLVDEVLSSDLRLEFLEFYALDLLQHWNLDRPEVVAEAYRRLDDFVRAADARARERGAAFVLLVDHGQEAVRGTVDLTGALEALDVAEDEYEYYLQVPSARFWFRTDRAREAIRAALQELEHVVVLDYRDLAEHGAAFESDEYGELYAYAEPGWVFFPHDFYHPLANLLMALRDPVQRPRLRSPVHRGCHGYLTGHDSEVGFFLTTDPGWKPARGEAELVDVAPTVLSMLGEPVPERMSGWSLLEPRG